MRPSFNDVKNRMRVGLWIGNQFLPGQIERNENGLLEWNFVQEDIS